MGLKQADSAISAWEFSKILFNHFYLQMLIPEGIRDTVAISTTDVETPKFCCKIFYKPERLCQFLEYIKES